MIRVYKSKWPEPFFYEWVNKNHIEYPDDYNRYHLEEYLSYFNNKCVFCESSLSDMKLMVGHYRPTNGALNITNGHFSENHYRWLDKDWSNTLVLCVECHRTKSNRFPLEGEFCSPEADEIDLTSEKRLLINPFRDFPEKHFLYDEEGIIIPKTKKGEVTVEVLNLNRHSLIEGRRREYSHFNRVCQAFIDNKEDEGILEEIIKQISQEAPFAGIKRYFLLKMIADDLIPYVQDFTPYLRILRGRNPITREDIQNKVAKEKYFNNTKKMIIMM